MFANCWTVNKHRWVSAASTLLLLTGSATAAEPAGADKVGAPPAQRVVLRVSEGMLNEMWGNQDIDRHTDVRDSILGTSIFGRARVIGTSRVQLAESTDQAKFQMIFRGTAHSRTTGYNGPAIIYSRAVTAFTATKQIVFEPGEGFRSSPSQVWARTQTFVEGIGSRRGGLIGRIVQRRAARTEAELHAEATEIARQKTARRIAVSLDRTSEERLARLNRISRLPYLAAAALSASGSGQPRFAYSTTPQYLQIATSFRESGSPIELPVADAREAGAADAQVWLHESLGRNDRIVAAIDFLNPALSMSNFLKAVSITARIIGGRSRGNPLGPLLAEQPFRIQTVGDWRVIAVNMPTDMSPAIARVSAPRTKPPSPQAVATAQRTRPPAFAPAPIPRSVAPHSLTQDTSAQASAAQPLRPPLNNRIWTSGPYHADATFLALEGNIVRLLRTSGVRASIPIEKLSPTDQLWIRDYLASQ